MAFKKFFLREFEADQPEAVAGLLADLGMSDRRYLEYLAGEGREAYKVLPAGGGRGPRVRMRWVSA
jgi:hypothetical protein